MFRVDVLEKTTSLWAQQSSLPIGICTLLVCNHHAHGDKPIIYWVFCFVMFGLSHCISMCWYKLKGKNDSDNRRWTPIYGCHLFSTIIVCYNEVIKIILRNLVQIYLSLLSNFTILFSVRIYYYFLLWQQSSDI